MVIFHSFWYVYQRVIGFLVKNGDLVRGFTELENGGSFHSYICMFTRPGNYVGSISH